MIITIDHNQSIIIRASLYLDAVIPLSRFFSEMARGRTRPRGNAARLPKE